MQYSLFLNQVRMVEWSLNLQQAVLFSFLYELPSWCESKQIDGKAFYWISKEKVAEELPAISPKPDTIKRYMASLEKLGVIERVVISNKTHVRITDKGRTWNKAETQEGAGKVGKKIPTTKAKAGKKNRPSGEKNPDQVGKNIPTKAGEISRSSGEKNPAYQYTSDQADQNQPTHDQITNDQIIVEVGGPNADFHPAVPARDSATPPASPSADLFALDVNQPFNQSATPDHQKFNMHWEWLPGGMFNGRCQLLKINVSSIDPDQQEEILGEFRSYWSGKPLRLSQSDWEHKLAKRMQALQVNAASHGHQQPVTTPAGKRAMVSEEIMNVNDTNW
ncbi:DnaT-like ssDNA-binding domain-containing protein [Aliamphritea hakodatensis]|uniref:DnaT-like ssDNA-binding domain-containing protein n=1 Tax=Aliamphritea hakodatensis TaxID=2895352 RepID=UPI0022FD5CAE|nr:DnaT-like ssDNA-binding domain-containing protein [Aliamphritea hakodatensis]